MSAPSPTVTRDGELITVVLPTDSRMTAVQLARKAAGGMVANTGQPVTRKGRGYVYTYSVVTREAPKAAPKPAVDPKVRARVGKAQTRVTTGEDDRLAFLERELARVTALLAQTVGEAPTAPKAPKAPKARPAYVPTAEQARRAKGGHACETCQDLHVVRGSGPRAGEAYRTAAGAAGATAPVPCPTCKGKRARRSA